MNVATLVSRAGKWFGNRTAIMCRGRTRTFAQIDENANRFANGLRKLGMTKGDRVGLYADNSVEYLEVIFGLFKSGLVGVGINTMLSPKEVPHIINDSGARVIVTSPRVAAALSALKSQTPSVESCICIGETPEGMTNYEGFIKNKSTIAPSVELEEDDLFQLFYTGGTTGIPKGVMITQRVVLNVLMNMQADFCHTNPSDIVLSAGSLAHANGYYSLLTYIQGAKLIIPEGYDPADVLSTVEKERVTMLHGYPVTLIRLIDYPDIGKYRLDSVRLLTYGASPMPTDKLKKALHIFGNKMCQGYGQAECLMTITRLTPEDHAFALAFKPERLASCGRPYLTQEVRIVDDDEREVPKGEVGEVAVRGGVCMKGYWNNPKATAKTVRGGWVHTGDIGWVDDEGYMYLVDRKKDIIISGGENIYAREVEDVLNSHPAIAEACVIGVPDEAWGESIRAVVVLKPNAVATGNEIVEYCKERLASFKKPKSVEIVEALPRTAAGKISKRELRDRYWAGRERKI